MSHISSIGAALFSDLSVCTPATDFTPTDLSTLDTAAEFSGLFLAEIVATGIKAGTFAAKTGMTFVRVGNARSFPAMGTPANIVKVPTYGSKTSQSIQGQADAPQLEIDINFVADQWAKPSTGTYVSGTDSVLGKAVGDGVQYVFRFALLTTEPTGSGATKYATVTPGSGLASAPGGNSSYYWYGKMEALLVTPSLTDAVTAKLTMSIQSPFYGAFTFN
jgi:hypothetical protein